MLATASEFFSAGNVWKALRRPRQRLQTRGKFSHNTRPSIKRCAVGGSDDKSGNRTRSSRRLLLSVVSLGSLFGQSPRSLVTSGMNKFRQGDIAGSLSDFDAACNGDPRLQYYMWQRGISLYYAGQFEEGAAQFRKDVANNPNDSEEAIWTFMCEARTVGTQSAQKNFLEVGRDSRPVLRAALDCFKTGAEPLKILEACPKKDGGGEHFYALLYVGLWNEAYDNSEVAEDFMLRAIHTPYAKLSTDYMASVAEVHCKERGWDAV